MNKTQSNPAAFTMIVDGIPTTYLDIPTEELSAGDHVVNCGPILRMTGFGRWVGVDLHTYSRQQTTSRIIVDFPGFYSLLGL